MKRLLKLLVVLLALASITWGDAGVLIPRDKAQPDPAILSLEEMEITIRIDNSDARVFVKQIFANHTQRVEEGNYIFALNSHAVVSDFATWDGPVRIPAVILERKRAEEIYNQLKQQAIDPGLLQMGERTASEARHTSTFSAKIVPIPAYGTKRLEFEYHESIPVESFKSYFGIGLKPEAYHSQTARRLIIHFELRSEHPIRDFKLGSTIYPLKINTQSANLVIGDFTGENVALTQDFSVQYELDQSAGDSLRVLAYRNPDSGQPDPTEMSPQRSTNEPGFVEVEALLASKKAAGTAAPAHPPHNVIVLFDNSLSMQWDKLERSYEAMQKVLHSLSADDHFNLVMFNSKVTPFQPAMSGVTPVSLQKVTDFVRSSRLRGGTDLERALESGLAQCVPGSTNNYLVLLTDGSATRGPILSGKLAAWYADKWKALPEPSRPKLFVFAVGDDANLPLLRMLTRNNGLLESVLSTEPTEFKLNAFIAKMNMNPIGQLGLAVSPSVLELVYPLQDTSFAGSMASWVGQYKTAQKGVGFDVRGVRDGDPFNIHGAADLPQKSLEHDQLPRLWARARVDALLEKIEREGEDKASIDEIIRLARKYKFVTPYTSFLAVPRALLRPRVIRPGDPVLRVRTDLSIVSVVALFPFGLTKPLRYLEKEDVWQTRFLAPVDMEDGTHTVRLVLRDRNGAIYRESKTFVIASKPPTVKIILNRKQFRKGESIPLRVQASSSTRTLLAQLEGGPPVNLRWNPDESASTGVLQLPGELAPGRYRLTVTAEDIAHNIGAQEVQIEVIP
jgi:Ca-activated chloride channel homolog